MKHLLRFLLVLFLAAPAWAGTTSLTGTVFDASNNPAVDGFVRFTIQPLLPNVVYRDAGTGIIVRTSSTCNIQSNGTILDTDNTTPCQMFDNDTITPANSFYKIELAPGGVVSDTFFAFITGATADLSTLLLATPSAAVPPPSFSVVLLPTISGDLNVTGDATVDGDVSVGGQFIQTIVPVAFSPTMTFNAALGSIFTTTLTGNVTAPTITNAVIGQIITIHIAQDGTGGRTFVWPANVILRGGLYNIDLRVNTVSTITLYFDGTNWEDNGRATDDQNIITGSILNVKVFGATGDGTTDDATDIQAAIDDTAGATVFFPCGTYRGEEIVLRNDVSLRGAGACSKIKGTDGITATESVVIVGGDSTCTDCGIFDLVLDGNQDVTGHSNTQNHTLDIRSGVTNFLSFHVKFTDTGGDGVRISSDGIASPDTPTGIHLISNDFSNHERQDISVVGGTKITIEGNIGDGILNIEPPTTPISDVTVSGGNQFLKLTVSNANVTDKAEFVIDGNIFGSAIIFSVRGVTFTGNTILTGTLEIGSADDIGVFGNNLRALDIWPPTAATRIKATGNIISHVTENAVAPPKVGQGTKFYAVAMRLCTDCVVENNEIRTELGGFLTNAGNPNSEFKNNKLVYAGGSPEPIAIEVSTTATLNDFVIDGNYADGFDQMLKIDGALFCDNCKVTHNTAINSTLTTALWDFEFNRLSNGLVAWNQIHGNHNGILLSGASVSARVVFNYFHNTNSSSISVQLTNSTASLGWNIDKVLRTTTLVLSGTPTSTFEDRADPIRSFSSTDTTPSVLNGRVFKTTNAGSTTITDFDDGTDGMRIWLIVNDANTTIADNANINLMGGANKKYVSGDVLHFILDGTVWNEVPLQSEWTARRFKATGTALVAGDFSLAAGWGTTASVGTITGNDQWAQFTITSAGTGQGANPTATLTFKDGTWTNAPITICQRADRANQAGIHFTWVATATTLVITFEGTPVAAETFVVSCHVGGV